MLNYTARPTALLVLALVVAHSMMLSSSAAPADEPESTSRLVVWALHDAVADPGTRAAIEAFVETRNFGRARTGKDSVEITVRHHPGIKGRYAFSVAAIGGSPPDVVHADRSDLPHWASKGILLPLDGHDAAMDAAFTGPDAFYDACWREVLYEGRPYGVPDDTELSVLIVNRSDYGGDPTPDFPGTLEELRWHGIRLTDVDDVGAITRLGLWVVGSPDALHLLSVRHGGGFLDDAGTRSVVAEPHVVTALSSLVDIEADLGGRPVLTRFLKQYEGGVPEAIAYGSLVMAIGATEDLRMLARIAPSLDVVVTAVPAPARLRSEPTTVASGGAWAIPVGTRDVEFASDFVRWMVSPDAARMAAQVNQAHEEARGRTYFPRLSASPSVNGAIRATMTGSRTTLTPSYRAAYDVCLGLANQARPRPSTPSATLLRRELDRAIARSRTHEWTSDRALRAADAAIQREMDDHAAVGRSPVMPRSLAIALSLLTFGGLAALFAVVSRGSNPSPAAPSGDGIARPWGWLIAGPWILFYTALVVLPVVANALTSVLHYSGLGPLRVAFFGHYLRWIADANLLGAAGNTALVALCVPLSMLCGLCMALLVKSAKRLGRIIVLATIATVAVPPVGWAYAWLWLLNPAAGPLAAVASLFGIGDGATDALPWVSDLAVVLSSTWMLAPTTYIWLLGLRSIPAEAYDAAHLDGAGRVASFVHVALPRLVPHALVTAFVGLASVLNLVIVPLIIANGLANSRTPVYGQLLLDAGLGDLRFGYAALLTLPLSIIAILLACVFASGLRAWTPTRVNGD